MAILRIKGESGEWVEIPAIKGDTGAKGDKGDTGAKGDKGDTGATPAVSVAEIDGGHRVTIGESTFDVMNGTNAVDTVLTIRDFNDVKNAVRLGYGEKLFPVGYEFVTHDSTTNADITWVVRAHNHHKPANTKLQYSMTLETKNAYSASNGSHIAMQFDAPEALYYAENGLSAGTYNFTLSAGHDTAYGGGKTISFTTTKDIPVGGVITFPWAYQKQSTDTKIYTYASLESTTAIETLDVVEGANGTALDTSNINYTQRVRYGSNNYAQSALRQWLLSSADAGKVWKPTTKFDRAPSWATSRKGFMSGLPSDFLDAVQPAVIMCRTNSVFETNSNDGTEFAINQTYELHDKFFLLSRPETYGSWDSSVLKDGEILEYYVGLTNTERRKFDTAGTVRYVWLRSPNMSNVNYVRLVGTDGIMNNNNAAYAYGVAPACIIA